MPENTSHELDKLFQQGAEQHDFQYNASAWSQMEKLLQKERRKILWWWFAGVGILAMGASIWMLSCNRLQNEIPESNKEISTLKAQQIAEATEIGAYQDSALLSESTELSGISPDADHVTNATTNSEIIDSLVVSNTSGVVTSEVKSNEAGQTTSTEVTSSKSIETAHAISTAETELKSSEEAEVKNAQAIRTYHTPGELVVVESAFPASVSSSTDPGIAAQSGALVVRDDGPIVRAIPAIGILPGLPLEQLGREWLDLAQDNIEMGAGLGIVIVNTSKTKGSLFVGATLSSELTSIGSTDFSDVNFSYGGHVEYRFHKFFGVSLGANYIKKNYEAGTGEYVPPKGFWTRKIPPTYTIGETSILEVPLLLGYYHKGYRKSGIYSQLGLTSYFLLKERYNYFYDLTDPDLISEWGTNNENQHWFGIGQISVGYNHVLSPRASFQIAPYLQIPLTGIGHGNLKMWTFGLQLKVNFRAF